MGKKGRALASSFSFSSCWHLKRKERRGGKEKEEALLLKIVARKRKGSHCLFPSSLGWAHYRCGRLRCTRKRERSFPATCCSAVAPPPPPRLFWTSPMPSPTFLYAQFHLYPLDFKLVSPSLLMFILWQFDTVFAAGDLLLLLLLRSEAGSKRLLLLLLWQWQ